MSEDLQPCALYRHFDELGVLLYVGISHHPERRTGGHISSSAWVRYADRGSVEWLPNLSRALVVERQAIQAEKPIYNRQGAEGDVDERIARYLYLRDSYYGTRKDPQEPGRSATPPPPGVGAPPPLPQVLAQDDLVTIAEAVERGLLSRSLDAARRAAGRPGFPEPVGRSRTAHVYRVADLRVWEAEKLRRAVS